MRNLFKKITLVFSSLVILMISNTIYGATASISASKTSAYVGDSVTINVSVNAAAWNLNVNGSGITGSNITGFNMEGANQITNKSYTLNTSSAGTYTIYLKGDISDGDTDVTQDISKSVTVTVNTKPEPVTPPANNTPTTTPKPNMNQSASKPNTNNNNTSSNTNLSSNAYLKEFRIDQPGITPAFSKTTYNYSITVNEDVDIINVTAVPENNKASVIISGNTNLVVGENVITVKVIAQDKKTTNTYNITVTKSDDPIKSNAYLQNIIITNAILTPAFSSEVFEYDLGIIQNEIDKLDIAVFPVNQNAKVEIIGNDNLVSGENAVQIIVNSENEKIQKTYTLKLYKEDEKALAYVNAKDTDEKVKEDNNFTSNLKIIGNTLKENATILLLYAFVWIEFLQVVYLYEKLKKYENKEEIIAYSRLKEKLDKIFNKKKEE